MLRERAHARESIAKVLSLTYTGKLHGSGLLQVSHARAYVSLLLNRLPIPGLNLPHLRCYTERSSASIHLLHLNR